VVPADPNRVYNIAIMEVLLSKPVLIGIHLGFAILAIDAFLWLAGEYAASTISVKRRVIPAVLGLLGFLGTWITGGYYYVKYYGSLVKPTILQGLAPWAHSIAMEAKEHVFLLLVPLAVVSILAARSQDPTLRRPALWLALLIAAIGLSIGAMGFAISAAARWGVIAT